MTGYTPWLDDGDVRLYHGDALTQLAGMPSESVHMIVTSPPFWGLRDYGTGSWEGGDADCDHLGPAKASTKSGLKNDGRPAEQVGQNEYERGATVPYHDACGKCGAKRVDQQIGLEETPDEWCSRLVAVMREARRVLRSDGVCWIEVGDTYLSKGWWPDAPSNNHADPAGLSRNRAPGGRAGKIDSAPGIKQKDLVGAPWMLAFALRADGWYLRSDTIWARPNPMPESVTDRPTKAHSYVFLLTKASRYFYDADAIREDTSPTSNAWTTREVNPATEKYQNGAAHMPRSGSLQHTRATEHGAGRNARSVWSIPTEPTPFAHFATFPQALVERCIKAGTSEAGCCSECGAPWKRVTETVGRSTREKLAERGPSAYSNGQPRTAQALDYAGGHGDNARTRETLYWEPDCKHNDPTKFTVPAPMPCVVLDPFMGSATTALVARRLGRHAIGIELNAEYLAIAATRLEQLSLLA